MANEQDIDPEPIPIISWRRQRLQKTEDGTWVRIGKIMRVCYNVL